MSERFLQYERKLLSLETLKNKRTKKTVTKKRRKETPIGELNRGISCTILLKFQTYYDISLIKFRELGVFKPIKNTPGCSNPS